MSPTNTTPLHLTPSQARELKTHPMLSHMEKSREKTDGIITYTLKKIRTLFADEGSNDQLKNATATFNQAMKVQSKLGYEVLKYIESPVSISTTDTDEKLQKTMLKNQICTQMLKDRIELVKTHLTGTLQTVKDSLEVRKTKQETETNEVNRIIDLSDKTIKILLEQSKQEHNIFLSLSEEDRKNRQMTQDHQRALISDTDNRQRAEKEAQCRREEKERKERSQEEKLKQEAIESERQHQLKIAQNETEQERIAADERSRKVESENSCTIL